MPTLTDLVERIVLSGVALTSRALSGAADEEELTFQQWRVIVVVGSSARGRTITEVAQRVGVTVPATSRQLRRLHRRGLVSVAPDPGDRRASRAQLTTRGENRRRQILAYRRREIRRALRSVPAAGEGGRNLLESVADAMAEFD